MAAAPIPTTARRRGDRSLETTRAALQRELDPRYVQFPSFAHQAGSEPLVVPLATADLLGDMVSDPYAMVRSRATLHLTGRAVLVGPWGGGRVGGTGPAACGLCLGLYWQRLRGGPERRAREWGHDPAGWEVQPVLTPYAVEVLRGVWSAVFGSRDAGPADAGPADPGAADCGFDEPGFTGPDGRPVAVPGLPAVAGEGPVRVTCVDLRVPVPRTYSLLPEPPCGLHTGCRG